MEQASSPDQSDSLLLHIELNEASKASENWNFTATLNKKIVGNGSYSKGGRDFRIAAAGLQQGYNQFRTIVMDVEKRTKLADISKFYFNASGGAMPLPQSMLKENRQDWGKLHWGKSIEDHEMVLDGQHFTDGFSTHASSETTFNLEGKFRAFRTSFGLDDESLCSEGVSVQILGDGNVLASSPVFQNGTILTLSANTEGVQKLTLKTVPKGSIDCSHVDFVHSFLIP